MRLEKVFLIIALIAIALAIPIALVLKQRTDVLNIEKSRNGTLQIQLDTKQKELEQKNIQIEQEKQKQQELEKQLQSKREAALAKAQAQKAPVVFKTANCADYRGLVAQYDWDVDVAMAVMRAESGCNANILSRTCDRGLMQVNCVHKAKVAGNLSALFNPETNIRVAYAIYKGAGWRAWSAYKNGAYLKYL